MYIAKVNSFTDKKEIVEFITRFSFGTMISVLPNRIPIATHLPFCVNLDKDNIVLNAYISPKNYEKELNVPTWNYMSVHLYGKGKVIEQEQGVLSSLEQMIVSYEDECLKQWRGLPDIYKLNMLKGLVAFEVYIDKIQASKKLSQNKSSIDKQNIINTLSKSLDTNDRLIAEYMKSLIM